MKSEVPFIQQQGFENNQMQQNLVQKLNLLSKIPIFDGSMLTSISLSIGDNKISHKLQRKYQGWFLTKIDAASNIYQVAADDESQFLTLNSSASAVVNIWVF